MDFASFAYVDFTHSHTQSAHQLQGVLVCAVGGAETRHRNADDARAVDAEDVDVEGAYEVLVADDERAVRGDHLGEPAGAHHHRERRVQAAADADDGALRVRVLQSSYEAERLNGEYLLAATLQLRSLRHKG